MTTVITRTDLSDLKGMSPRLLRAFEELFVDTANNTAAVAGQVESTGAIQNATVITLSSNTAFNNERVLVLGPGLNPVDGGPGDTLTISLAYLIVLNGGFQCTFNLEADTNLDLPSEGRVCTSALDDYADDAAAAAGGVAIGSFYRTGSAVKVRVA